MRFYAQNFGNEWIDFSQKYFSFQVVEDGWYRLDYATINSGFQSQGVDISTINTNAYQVIGREKELSIHVQDGGDGVLNPGDYIEFYGQKNDGWKDSLLFEDPADMADAYYSFVNDTINYYITFKNIGVGKRIQDHLDVNLINYPVPDYCWTKNYVRHVTSSYNYGPLFHNLSSPVYGRGEGWTLGSFNHSSYKDTYINTKNAFTGVNSPNAIINSAISSASNPTVSGPYNHSFKMQYTNANIDLKDTAFFGYDLIKLQAEVDPSTLNNGNTRVRHRGISIGQGGNEKLFLSSVSIIYPHTFDMEGASFKEFWLSNSISNVKQTLHLSNFNAITPRLFVLNDGLVKELPLVANGTDWDVVVPNNMNNDSIHLLYLADENHISIANIKAVSANAQFSDLNNLLATDAFIIVTHSTLMGAASQYANYRSSALGRMNDVVLVDIDELYHQFGGGIEKHPVAIRSFIDNSLTNWGSKPKHLFLMGKSIGNKADQNLGSRESTTSFHHNLVPTWGYPGSDNHITQGLDNSENSYGIATGRLSATTPQQVLDYLDKVMAYENEQVQTSVYDIPNKEWQKTVLHFNGCTDPSECLVIDSYINQFTTTIEDTLFGAMSKTYKRDPNSTVLNSQDFFKVQQHLLDGVSLITFYGHASSGGGFSQNIDDPSNWNNFEKYPVVIGLGCYTGDVHGVATNTYTDQLILAKDEGAVAFTSTVKLGFISNIGYYTAIYYNYLSKKNYLGSIGESMKMTTDSLNDLLSGGVWNIPDESNYTAMSLQGDPSLRLNVHEKPEIVLDENRIWTTPSLIDLSVDTFDLNIVVTNIGHGFVENFDLSVARSTSLGVDSIFIVHFTQLMNRDTVVLRIPTKHQTTNGLNTFDISVDLPLSVVEEQYDETNNNQIVFSTYVSTNGLKPIWPYEYGIIPNDTATLKASTLNPFEPMTNYIFEIDTTDLFNSPFKKTQQISSIGGVIEAYTGDWIGAGGGSDSLVFTDSTVYFWRCSPDELDKNWLESSFQYIPDKWGWGQAHFFQYKNDYFGGINYNRTNRKFEFEPNMAKISVVSNISFTTGAEWNGTHWNLSGVQMDYGGWLTPSIMIGVVDPCSLEPWGTPWEDPTDNTIYNADHCFGQLNGDPSVCSGSALLGRDRIHKFFIFRFNNVAEMDSLTSMLNTKIPNGHYLIAYTYIPDSYTSPMNLYAAMPVDLITAFQNLGATNITNTQADDGFVFFARKGFPASVQEVHTPNTITGGVDEDVQVLTFETLVEGCELGTIKSELAGPAFSWNALYWQHHSIDNSLSDSSMLRVYGLDYNLVETLLIDTLMTLDDSILNLNTFVDPILYPYIRLEGEFHDTLTFTPSQMNRWQIIYEPVPELAVNPKKGFYSKNLGGVLTQGDSAQFSVAIENVSAFDMDSVRLDYWYNASNGGGVAIPYTRQDSLLHGKVLIDTVSFATANLSGLNYFRMVANPYVNGMIQDQPEQFYFNNIAQKSFEITEDNINPILDVTFDGMHILNEDIVSAKPEILITLDDENQFLLLDQDSDTSNFEVFLKRPNSNSFEHIYFMNGLGEEVLKWYPAENSKNEFKIEYNPEYTEDGIYTLQVQGRDKSNNFSGDFSYEISFEIITASTITHLFNYPNPFSTHTQFVYTLTGSALPDQMQIQVMTVTGKVVREIDLAELGAIHVGNNRTEYAWDGKDQFGDQLANGVYLYRVIAKINGKDIDHRETNADIRSFKQGFGKMYLLR